MKKDKLDSTKSGVLRKKAEKTLKEKPSDMQELAGEGVDKIIHELEVHQIELEMQNDEIRRALIELEESRHRYSDLYDFAPIGYFILDKNSLIHNVNLTGAAMVAQARASLIKKPFHLYVADDFKDLFYLHRRKVFDTQTKQSCEIKLVRKDGTSFWGLFESKTVADNDGNLKCWTAISDITSQKRAEQQIKLLNEELEQRVIERTAKLSETGNELQESEEKYRQLVKNANCIIIRRNIKGEISFFNEFAQTFFGYSEPEVIGKDVIGIIVPETDSDGQNVSKMIRDITRQPELYAANENENICKDGRHVWVAWTNKVIHDERGNSQGILCVGHDITERKHMEKQLQLLAAAVHNSNDAITILDLEGRIISWNLGAERIYGYSNAEAMKMNISRIIPDHKQDEIMLLTKRLLKGEKIEFYETQRLTKNNRILNISITATALEDEKGKPFAVTTTERDMTDRRSLEKEILNITEREREQIGQEMHDGMGQVLTGIAVLCKGLALKLKDRSSEEMKTALTISELANKAIAQTRDLAKMLYPVDIETGGLVSALQTLASNTEKILGVRCQFKCDKSVSVKILVEAKQVYRIAQEAITNAVRHGKAKHIHITLRLTKKGTVLSIESDGLDFPKVPHRKGFGLKIMQYRTDLIGGSLDIRKGNKGGTVVTCVFPNDR